LFILRRIRHRLREQNQPKLTGTVEVDEVHVKAGTRCIEDSSSGDRAARWRRAFSGYACSP
jgi:hypothetical protein